MDLDNIMALGAHYFHLELEPMAHRFKLIIQIALLFHIISCKVDSKKIEESISVDEIPFKKVLMIGNSFTFYWNLPQVLERMFATKDIRVQVDQKTIGGSKLSEHWNYNLDKNYRIEDYDYVIFNDHSTYAMKNLDTCAKYIKLFTSQIHKINSKPLIYGTWEYPSLKKTSKFSNSNTMKRLDSLAKVYKATYVPVGNAFDYVEKNHPEFKLYMDDQKHPSANATYLSACIFFSMITGETPLGLPTRFEGKNIDGKKIYYLITDINAAIISQKVANLITSPFRKEL
mgnify:CR=1 FL=1